MESVSINFTKAIIETAKKQGGSALSILRAAGLDEKILEDPESRISFWDQCEVWKSAVEVTNDEFFGLHVGERVLPGTFSVVGYSIMSSPTLEDALKRVKRYQSVVGEGGTIDFEIDKSHLSIFYEPIEKKPSDNRHRIEAILTSWMTFGRWITGLPFEAKSVHFKHSNPGDISEYKRIFHCNIQFEQNSNKLLLDRQLLNKPLVQANHQLCEMFDRLAEKELQKIGSADLSSRVKLRILKNLAEGNCSKEIIARQLHLTPKSLQRRLKEENSSFQRILDKTREELSSYYLGVQDIPISEVAMRLGYSESGTFHRAFKRWTSESPGQFRKKVDLLKKK